MKLVAAVLVVAMGAAHAQYKCVDSEGKTTFQQTACPAAQKQQTLNIRVAPSDAPAPRASGPSAKSVDERIWETMRQDRQIQELELRIADVEGAINGRNNQMNVEMEAIRGRKAYAKNNLAGATWEQSLSTEMQAVASKYKTMNDADFERLKVLRAELEALRAPASK